MVDASKRATSMEVCLSNSNVILPQPFPDVELIFFTPFIRANIASNLEVASISIIRAALLGIENETVSAGSVRDGANFTGKSGMSAMPISAMLINVTMTVKADMEFFLDILSVFCSCKLTNLRLSICNNLSVVS